MYTDVENVRILVALLKKYGIQDAVLSSGTCSIPVLQSLEADEYFNCYSDVDERSAAYVAIGIAQVKKNPVAVVCTSGTAVCNYLPGVCEAKRLGVPLVIITCDKAPHTLGHMVIQKVSQENIFGDNCKFAVNIPVIQESSDRWAVEMMISQALMETQHHGNGPVQINIYTDGDKKTFNTPSLPLVKKINRISGIQLHRDIKKIREKISSFNRIMVVCGENSYCNKETVTAIENFCRTHNAVIIGEPVSNVDSEMRLNTYRLTEQLMIENFKNNLKPDLVISFGGNFAAYEIKSLLKSVRGSVTHWWIDPAGEIVDTWRMISSVFEMTPKYFFNEIISENQKPVPNEYHQKWQQAIDNIKIPEVAYSSMFFMDKLSKELAKRNVSIMHMGILNSTRLGQLFDMSSNIRAYSNLGALGIDGSLSSFLGQASVQPKGINVCVVGDLSFIYDINALAGTEFPSNIKMVLLNNGGGSEFHLNTGLDVIPTLDRYISAGHSSKVGRWTASNGLKYFTITKEEECVSEIRKFLDYEGAAFLEVYTDIEIDSQVIKQMYQANGYVLTTAQKSAKVKKLLTKVIGMEKTQRIAKMAKIWLGR